jgi:hypothetical protein
MGLVFAAIVLLWWMMALLTAIAADKKPASPKGTMSDSARPASGTMPASIMDSDMKARAAAIAVAVALAEHHASPVHPLSLPPTAIVSAWQLGMRTSQLSQKGTPIVRNPRKIG